MFQLARNQNAAAWIGHRHNALGEPIWQRVGNAKVRSKTYRVNQRPCFAFIGLAAADWTCWVEPIVPPRRRTLLSHSEARLFGRGFMWANWRGLYSQGIQASSWHIESLQCDLLFDAVPWTRYIGCQALLRNAGRRSFVRRLGMASIGRWIVAGCLLG